MISFSETLATFRAEQVRSPKRITPRSKAQRPAANRIDTSTCMYAIPQPKLCETMPHNWASVRKGAPLCVRCGTTG